MHPNVTIKRCKKQKKKQKTTTTQNGYIVYHNTLQYNTFYRPKIHPI